MKKKKFLKKEEVQNVCIPIMGPFNALKSPLMGCEHNYFTSDEIRRDNFLRQPIPTIHILPFRTFEIKTFYLHKERNKIELRRTLKTDADSFEMTGIS